MKTEMQRQAAELIRKGLAWWNGDAEKFCQGAYVQQRGSPVEQRCINGVLSLNASAEPQAYVPESSPLAIARKAIYTAALAKGFKVEDEYTDLTNYTGMDPRGSCAVNNALDFQQVQEVMKLAALSLV